MKTDPRTVTLIAAGFPSSWRARLWAFVAPEVRLALLDSLALDCMRLATSYADGADAKIKRINPVDFLAFRAAIETALATSTPPFRIHERSK